MFPSSWIRYHDHKNLLPCLVEVNNAPSINIDEPLDDEVKYNLINDTFGLLKLSSGGKADVVREDKEEPFLTVDKWRENVEWEELHTENYRQIVPCADAHKYTKVMRNP